MLTETLSGIVERVTFFSEETGWSVLKVAPFNNPGDVVAVTVHQAKVYAGATMEFTGNWIEHSKFGQQFKAVDSIEKKPASSAALEKYLGSGLIHGVGPKTAKKIVAHFKDETMDIFEKNIHQLTEVEGIAKKKLQQISDAWTEHREIRNVMMFLQNHGISTLFAVKIYKQYGNTAIDIVQNNPYRLSKDIYGVGFLSADKIAASVNIEKKDPRRIKAAINHVLAGSREEGHCYLTFNQVTKGVRDLLNDDLDELVSKSLVEMEAEHDLKVRVVGEEEATENFYYSKTLYYSEKYVAEKICCLLKNVIQVENEKVQKWIESFNKSVEFPLSKEQSDSVMGIVGKSVSVLTGGPGCGKTTTTKAVVRLALAMGKKVGLAAPTGRAAQRMEQVIGLPAKTIHRLLVWNPANGGFKFNEEEMLDFDFIIVDECSMLDISLTTSLMKAINPASTQVLLIGDKDQLPSVGPGNVLKDLIQSAKLPVFHLTQIFRQAKESYIIKHAHEINRGITPKIESPFNNPSVWKKGVDSLFIDSEEITQEGLKFIRKTKNLFKENLANDAVGIIHTEVKEKDSFKKIVKSAEDYYAEELSENELEELKSGRDAYKIFSIPQKFNHVEIENLLSSKNELAEIKEVLKKIHPWSSLNYGIKASDMIVKLYSEIIPKYFGRNIEIQILSPMTRGSMGTVEINKKIQHEFNRFAKNKKEIVIGDRIFRVEDRVIQKRNNYDLEVFNGDIGKIVDIDLLNNELVVSYPEKKEKLVIYKKENIIELSLAYAITIHKSQGSEFEAVIIPVATQHFKMLFRNLIYTGLTRAKKLIVFVGTRKALAMAARNCDNKQRQTYLKELIQKELTD